MCPLTQKEYNGFNKFLAYWDCGCIVSADAEKEIRTLTKLKEEFCIVCEKSVSEVIDLNMSDDAKNIKYEELVEKAKKDKLRKMKKRSKPETAISGEVIDPSLKK